MTTPQKPPDSCPICIRATPITGADAFEALIREIGLDIRRIRVDLDMVMRIVRILAERQDTGTR